ncbi:hypothetical protein P692DRAFT_20743958, partial [Suillus brevipes Sb2]
WLEQANKLMHEEYASYFWEGIYKKLRTKIESRLMSSEPDRDLSLAFPVDKVLQLQRNSYIVTDSMQIYYCPRLTQAQIAMKDLQLN